MPATPPRVACIGECMLELSGADPQAMRLSYGGDTLNTAVYLARLGVATDYVTALGDDPWSDWMVDQWAREGVGTGSVIRATGRIPGLYAIRTDDRGERRFFYWRDQAPARDLLRFPEFDRIGRDLAGYDCLYVSGITLSLYSAADRARLFDIVDAARDRGCRIAFDSNYRPRGWPDVATAKDVMGQMLRRTDIALPTLDDDRQVFGDTDADSCADRLHASGVADVAVKLGPAGCLVSDGTTRSTVVAEQRIRPVDTTGAGDSFNAAYLAARLAGATATDAARRANALAGTVILHRGAIMPCEAMPGDRE